jgi:hypothetical protein
LTRREQETARKKLVKSGVFEEVRKGVPCRVHYKVDIAGLEKVLKNHQFAQIRQTRFDKSAKLDSTKAPNKIGGFGETTHRLPGNTHTPPPPEPDSKGGGGESEIDEIDEYLELGCKYGYRGGPVQDPAGWSNKVRSRLEKQGGLKVIDRRQLEKWRELDQQEHEEQEDMEQYARAGEDII